MSFFDEYDPDVDPEDWKPKEPRCNRCGSLDVRWRQQTGKWVLFSLKPGVPHTCQPTDDGFSSA